MVIGYTEWASFVNSAQGLLENFYLWAYTFEQVVVRHRAFGNSVVGLLAEWPALDRVPAACYFCGAICTPTFVEREFVPVIFRRECPPISGA